MKSKLFLIQILTLFILATGNIHAQTSVFTYQGRLSDNSISANGTYQMQFGLYDSVAGGTQISSTIEFTSVSVVNGVFTVQLDFGGAAFDGADRFIEIAVRRDATETYTILNPRQPITSSPYAVKSQNSATADNALQLDGTPANQFIQEGDTRLTDARESSSIDFNSATINGVVPVGSGGTGSATQNFVDLSTNQTGIVGNKTFTGTVSGNIVNAATQYNIGDNRVLRVVGTSLIAGVNAGNSNTGVGNSFFGTFAGMSNTNGLSNSFFGLSAGFNNTGSFNSFFGTSAGSGNTSGGSNSFFGRSAGISNTAGTSNAFFGSSAGDSNTTGGSNTIIGSAADVESNNLTNATAIGANAFVSSSNSLVLGRTTSGGTNVGIGTNSPLNRLHIAHPIISGNQWGIRIQVPNLISAVGMRNAGNGSFEVTNNMDVPNFGLARLNSNGSWSFTSDIRLKQDIVSVSGLLAKALALRPVSYTFKSSPEIPQIGFIAQEVEALFPEFVTSGKSEDEMKTLNYSGLSVVAVGAIQEQQKQVDEQKTEIDLLKNQNQNQQIIISKLLRLVCSGSPDAEICKESN